MSDTIARIQELLATADRLRARGSDGHQQLLEIFAEISLLKARYYRESASRHEAQPADDWRAGPRTAKSFNTH